MREERKNRQEQALADQKLMDEKKKAEELTLVNLENLISI